MKRWMVLLLVLISFNVSRGEELNAEQQQLAWKFIYENMLSKEYLPTIFKQDIIINLKGDITSEDSIVVKDLIESFQKVMPTLKFKLCETSGNLILGLNYGKQSRITTNTSSDHSIISKEIYFPSDYMQSQRKRFIYYQLFRGLLLYNSTEKNNPEMEGCVFAENDFQKITYSPFDLFILGKLYAADFSIQLAQNLPPALQETAWNNIRSKFLVITKTPVIYRTDIAVKLKGTVSRSDSSIMNEVIDQVKMIIPNRKIYLTPDTGNLVLDFDPEPGVITKTSFKRLGNDILYKNVSIRLSDKITLDERKKTLYYYFTRSLFDLFISGNSMSILGSVFDEQTPQNITYTPLDAFVMNKLYADDFHEQFKNQFIQRFSYREYLVLMYANELYSIFFIFSLLIPSIFLIRLMLNGAFKPHNWNWKEYNKQGIYLIICFGLYLLINSLSDLYIEYRFLVAIIAFIQAMIAINLIYFAERLIFSKRANTGASKVIIVFIITLIGLTISSSISLKESTLTNNTLNTSIATNISFVYIVLFALARSLYLFLNDRYKSILNQKDVEIAQMNELHRQAELQSLRAKINPHFLYNALNSIASLATTDGRKTEQMALSLSDFFKYAINREQKQLNTLSEELNAIRTYLEIEKVRFGDRLNFEIECPAELMEVQIPQLLIQPLVENALKHGLSKITEKGFIKVSVTKYGSQLEIRVYDNGPAFPDEPLSGFGIQNTQERITLVYGAKAGINWQNEPDKYIEITLPLNNK